MRRCGKTHGQLSDERLPPTGPRLRGPRRGSHTLEAHHQAVADSDFVRVSDLNLRTAPAPCGRHSHEYEHPLVVHVEEALRFEMDRIPNLEKSLPPAALLPGDHDEFRR